MKQLARGLAILIVIASIARAYRAFVPRDPLPARDLRLRNGLHVILAPDATASSVVVQVRYESGAAIERPSEAGYTQLLAKLMSAGSVHVKDFDARVEALGGWSTSTATSDYLAVTEQVPAHALELVLWLEAERMAGLADGITDKGLTAAREAVDAEWRAAYVDEPYALATRELQRALWTGELAQFGKPVLGDGKAVQTASLDEVKRFARERLAPNNAVLVVAGRFELDDAKRVVERYFGWIPGREVVSRGGDIVVKPRDTPAVLAVKSPIASVVVAYRCEESDPAIEILAQLLAGGPTSRLHKRLVDNKLATEVHFEIIKQRACELRLYATPTAQVDPLEVAARIRADVAELAQNPALLFTTTRSAAVAAATQFVVAVENLAVRADVLATAGPRWMDHPQQLQLLTRDQLSETATRWLAERASVTVIARPEVP